MLAICRTRSQRPKTKLSKRRIMHSTGHNIVNVGIEDKYWKYLSDLYTTLIDIKWRWNILIFASGFIITWLFFACVYYLFSFVHGDFRNHDVHFVPCIQNVKGFTAAYLFSIETMMTIGYGFRVHTESCPGVYLTVMVQSILGAGLQFMLASIVVLKTRRAKRRSETILFSDNVCIYEQDSRLHLAVRVGDMLTSEIAGAHAQGFLVKKNKSKDGSYVPVRSYNVILKGETGRDDIFFPWPTQIIHLVDEDSPMWSLSRDELLKGKYELIVVIDGINGTTSRPFQARKSYHACEMKWGHRFENLELTDGSGGTNLLNLTNFDKTIPTSTPLCSAQDITHLREMYKANHTETKSTDDIQPSTSTPEPVVDVIGTADVAENKEDAQIYDINDNTSQTSSAKKSTFQRSKSVQDEMSALKRQRIRRCSLGEMIRVAQGENKTPRNLYADARNIYRHRRSVTDTYLGAGIEEEEDDSVYDSSQAALSIVSQRSSEKWPDVRDLLPKRRRSSIRLMFGNETENYEGGEEEYDSPESFFSVRSQRGYDRRVDVREVFPRRKSSVQLLFRQEPSLTGSDSVLQE